jgi:hypothetical protein
MDDFHSSAETLAKVGGGTYAFDWVVRLWGSWTSFLYANDGNLLEEGKYSGGDWLWNSKAFSDNPIGVSGRKGGWKWGDPTANSDAAVEALQYVIDLQKSGASPSPDVGGGPRVRLFDGKTQRVLADFFAIDDPNFRGGVRIALGDLNGDGVADLIAGAGFGGGPRVAIFDGETRDRLADFDAYEDSAFRGGVTVATGASCARPDAG